MFNSETCNEWSIDYAATTQHNPLLAFPSPMNVTSHPLNSHKLNWVSCPKHHHLLRHMFLNHGVKKSYPTTTQNSELHLPSPTKLATSPTESHTPELDDKGEACLLLFKLETWNEYNIPWSTTNKKQSGALPSPMILVRVIRIHINLAEDPVLIKDTICCSPTHPQKMS